MPAAATGVKQTVEVGKPGEYKIVIGDSLKRSADVSSSSDDEASASGDTFTSVKYNYKPTTSLSNPTPPHLTKHAPKGPAPYTLSLSPPGNSSKAITYTGSQHVHPPRKTECILLFDPATQSFTLEKLTSTFTFNAKVFAPAHPALPLRPPILDGEETDEEEREEDNPFDYRHFINKKPTIKSRVEQKKEREQRRKEALKRAGKDVPEDEPEEEDDDEDLGLGISYNGRPAVSGKGFLAASPAIGPRRNVGGKSPFAGKKPVGMSPGVRLPSPGHESESDEDESEEADDEEEEDEEMVAPPPPPPVSAPKRKAPVQRKKATATLAIEDPDPEVLVFPEPMAAVEPSDEEMSEFESEEDAPPPAPRQQAPPVVEEEDDEEEDDLAKLLEMELGDANADADAEGDEIIIDDDGEVRGGTAIDSGWEGSATNGGGGPISIATMMGRADDDSETSEEE